MLRCGVLASVLALSASLQVGSVARAGGQAARHPGCLIQRRGVCQFAAAAATTLLPQLASAADKVDQAAVKEVRETSAKLKAVLEKKEAFVQGLVEANPDAPTLPPAVAFRQFQSLEKVAGPDFMEAAIDYAEAFRNAKDLVKLAKLTTQTVEITTKEKGKPRETATTTYGETGTLGGTTKEYAERALQELLGASLALDAAISNLP